MDRRDFEKLILSAAGAAVVGCSYSSDSESLRTSTYQTPQEIADILKEMGIPSHVYNHGGNRTILAIGERHGEKTNAEAYPVFFRQVLGKNEGQSQALIPLARLFMEFMYAGDTTSGYGRLLRRYGLRENSYKQRDKELKEISLYGEDLSVLEQLASISELNCHNVDELQDLTTLEGIEDPQLARDGTRLLKIGSFLHSLYGNANSALSIMHTIFSLDPEIQAATKGKEYDIAIEDPKVAALLRERMKIGAKLAEATYNAWLGIKLMHPLLATTVGYDVMWGNVHFNPISALISDRKFVEIDSIEFYHANEKTKAAIYHLAGSLETMKFPVNETDLLPENVTITGKRAIQAAGYTMMNLRNEAFAENINGSLKPYETAGLIMGNRHLDPRDKDIDILFKLLAPGSEIAKYPSLIQTLQQRGINVVYIRDHDVREFYERQRVKQ